MRAEQPPGSWSSRGGSPIRRSKRRAVRGSLACAAIGVALLVLSLTGIGEGFDNFAMIAAAVAFAAAAIFLIMSIMMDRAPR